MFGENVLLFFIDGGLYFPPVELFPELPLFGLYTILANCFSPCMNSFEYPFSDTSHITSPSKYLKYVFNSNGIVTYGNEEDQNE